MAFNIRHLRVFLAVVDAGSVTKASAVLFRAQSAVTRSIHELERQLRVDLFERRARGMPLTEFGKVLLRRAKAAQAELERARRDLAAGTGPKRKLQNAPLFSLSVSELRLQAFVALTEQHHMPSVAEQLGITQPAVSIAVRYLEESIGVNLFMRTAKGMLPTEAGSLLALRIKRALAELRHAAAEISALNGVTQGRVTVGVALGADATAARRDCAIAAEVSRATSRNGGGLFRATRRRPSIRRRRFHPGRAAAGGSRDRFGRRAHCDRPIGAGCSQRSSARITQAHLPIGCRRHGLGVAPQRYAYARSIRKSLGAARLQITPRGCGNE
jgi:hypothetical protein